MYVAIIGPPGAGKGTQCAHLAATFDVPHISTGQILRDAIEAGVPAAHGAKHAVAHGALVDDATMLEIVRARLCQPDARHGALLDGFPRTLPQARVLDTILAERSDSPLIVVVLEVPEDELVRRLHARRRSDDTESTIRERLNNYVTATRPVVDFYQHRATFGVVDGSNPADLVCRDITATIQTALLSA
jgi:adenylate kinase